MDKLFFKRILVGTLSAFIVFYITYLFVGLYTRSSIKTENVVYESVSDIIYTDGFIVRDEVFVKNNSDEIISYNVSDGENVKVHQNIADVYASEKDALSRRKIKNIDKKINDLIELSNSYFKESVGIDTVNSQIENKLFSMLKNINTHNYSKVSQDSYDVLYYINERQLITGTNKNFSKKIKELKQEKANLENSCSSKISTITSKEAGYFISKIDGYEKSLSYDNIADVTLEDYKNIKKRTYKNDYIGKVVTNPEWYVVCKIDKDNALSLSKMQGEGLDVNIKIPFISSRKIPAEIVAINQATRQDNGILILSCDYMNEAIAKGRMEDIEIETAYYNGLKISKRSIYEDYVTKVTNKDGEKITEKKKVQGVYVLRGSEIIFKEIAIIHSTKNYVICNPTPLENVLFNGETVSLYDRVIIKGDNLYDGKIIE